jgi:DNA polymerase
MLGELREFCDFFGVDAVPPCRGVSGDGSLPRNVSSSEECIERLSSLEELRLLESQVKQCTKCRLAQTRNKVVFGAGLSTSPLIAFVGEGPGADEDRVGEPFVGKAGELLTRAITNGLKLRREDVYICNVVKCRPPNNRTPLPDETESCTPYLFRQLELIQPQVIVALGAPAQQALSGVKLGITKLRGQWQQWRGIKLMPTFHPAYILRNPAAKKDFWEDLQLVMKELGLS